VRNAVEAAVMPTRRAAVNRAGRGARKEGAR